jgi:putative PIN family toxin of toxin-antitoxin system
MRVVLDTSVLVAAARSRRGASFALVRMIPESRFEVCLSVGLYMEWVSVLTRSENLPPGISRETTLGFLRRLVSLSHLQQIHYLWRPFLPDPDDDMVLELAFAADCKYIVTHNLADFRGSDKLGIAAVSPGDFLEQLKKRT